VALALPDAGDKAAVVRAMFDRIAPRYDRLNSVLTMRLDRGWRRATLAAARIGPGDRVVDVACGTGDLVEIAARGLGARLVRGDALALPLPDASADALTCAFALRNFVAIPPFLAEAARVLRPGGRLAVLEVATPRTRLLQAAHHAYFHRAVPWLGALLAERDAYAYLPASTAYLPPAEALLSAIRAAGFATVERRLLGLGAVQLLSAERRPNVGGAA